MSQYKTMNFKSFILLAVVCGGVLLPSISLASLPSVLTQSATEITRTAATLNGTVNPLGYSGTTYWFEWGLSQSLGNATAPQSLPPDSTPIAVAAPVGGLGADTTYFFRAAAKNNFGTQRGAILSFHTLPGLSPSVTTLPPSSIEDTSAVVTGKVNPNGATTSFKFQYGLDRSMPNHTPWKSAGSGEVFVDVSEFIAGLTADTLYYYRVVGENAFGTVHGEILTFHTEKSGAAPSVLTNPATNIKETAATLNGAVNPNGSAANAWFEYSLNQTSWTRVGIRSVGSGASFLNYSFSLSGLQSNTTYFFRAAAENARGTSFGSILNFTTLGGGGATPSVTTNPATSITKTAATLNGAVNPNGAATDAWFEYGTTESLGTVVGTRSVGSGTKFVNYHFNLNGLTPGTTYFFRAASENVFGRVNGAILTFTTSSDGGGGQAPPVVITESATSITKNSAKLNATIDPNGVLTAAWFEIGTDESLGEVVGKNSVGSGSSPTSFSFTKTGLLSETTYFFRAAVESALGIDYGEMLSFVTEWDTTAPGPPIVFTNSATSVKRNSATLKGTVNPNSRFTNAWFEIGTDSSPDRVVGHQGVGSGSSYKSFSFAVTDLDPDTAYFYQAAAENSEGITRGEVFSFTTEEDFKDGDGGGGESGGSEPDVVTSSASNVGPTYATLHANMDPNSRSTTAWFEWGPTLTLGNTTSRNSVGSGSETVPFATSISGLQPNTNYYYRAMAENARGFDFGNILGFTTGSGSGGGSASGLPQVSTGQPQSLSPSSAELNGTVNPNGGFTSAWFEYGTSQSSLSAIGHRWMGSGFTTLTYSFTLFGLDSGITYYYRAVAQNGNGIAYGSLIPFVTNQGSGNAPLVTTSPASFVNAYSALVNGTVNPSGTQTTAWFEWGTTQSLGRQTTPQAMGSVTTSLNLAFALLNLNPNTTYYYRAVAENAGGTRRGSILSFTTPSAATGSTPPPPPPSALVRTVEVTKTSKGKVLVELTPSVDRTRPAAGDELNYTLLYRNAGEVDVTEAVLTITVPEVMALKASNREPDSRDDGKLIFKIGEIKAGGEGLVSLKLKIDKAVSRTLAATFRNRIEYLDDVKANHVFESILTIMVEARRGGFLSFLAGLFDLPGWLANLLLILLLLLVVGYIAYGLARDRAGREIGGGEIVPLAERFREAQAAAGE